MTKLFSAHLSERKGRCLKEVGAIAWQLSLRVPRGGVDRCPFMSPGEVPSTAGQGAHHADGA